MINSKISFFKKIISFILISSFLLCFSGCGQIIDRFSPKEPPTERPSVRLTFPEGSTVAEIAKILENGGVYTAEEFLLTAQNYTLLSEYGFEIPNPENRSFVMEGYLFPDTYDFYIGEGSESAARRFLKNSRSKFNDEIKARCTEIGYTLDEVLSIASIIQEEAGNPPEMGKVSSVLHNRLSSSSYPKLQCDANSFYLRDSVKPYVSEERYEVLLQLYSTYNCEGIQEGPITNSGIEAVKAALYPEETDYYFFITDSENNYIYAKTYKEHLQNCKEAGLD